MRVTDAIIEVLKREGIQFLSCYPTTPLIEAAAAAGLRPILCRQERVGVGIADGYSRASFGKRIGVFAMQRGPGAENAFSGVATAFSDCVPVLFLPTGHTLDKVGLPPFFSAVRSFAAVTKSVEMIDSAIRVPDIMRRAFSLLRMGSPGPVMVEIPEDVANEVVESFDYYPVRVARAAPDSHDIEEAAKALLAARRPLIHAGQGVLYAEAWSELRQLAEFLQIPVMTTLLGKSAFPEDHPLSLGPGYRIVPQPVSHFMNLADVVFGIGCSFSSHHQSMQLPPDKTFIHATINERDINKHYRTQYPILGDAKLVLRQLIDAVKDHKGNRGNQGRAEVVEEIKKVREDWLGPWMPKFTSDEVPLNPFRVIWDLMHTLDPRDVIITHDSGSPRDQLAPFYRAVEPGGYIGWGKSHGLGTGLGLIIGAKLARPEKITINVMGDAAFGMVGLDFETAVRNKIPIITIVLNNFTMGSNVTFMKVSHERYRTRDIIGNYADIAKALGGYAERVESPADIKPALQRAARISKEDARPVLLEFITSEETALPTVEENKIPGYQR